MSASLLQVHSFSHKAACGIDHLAPASCSNQSNWRPTSCLDAASAHQDRTGASQPGSRLP